MKMLIDADWLRKKAKEEEDVGPIECPHCGAIAGCCDFYPKCPGGNEPYVIGAESEQDSG